MRLTAWGNVLLTGASEPMGVMLGIFQRGARYAVRFSRAARWGACGLARGDLGVRGLERDFAGATIGKDFACNYLVLKV